MQTRTIAKFRIPGTHRWPTAPDGRCYLRDPHRHMFHFTVSVVLPQGRAEKRFIECHNLIALCINWLQSDYLASKRDDLLEFGSMSCEEIARKLVEHITARLEVDSAEVEVLEDGEAGGSFWNTRPPDPGE